MNLEQYNRIHDFFITHSSAFSLLLMANRFLTACGFFLYPLLLLFLLLKGELLMLCSFIFIPAICFLIVTKREKGTVFPKPPCIFYLFNCNIMVLFLETNRNLSSYCWHFSRNCQSNWRRTFYKRRMCRSVSWYHRRVDF